MSGDMRIHYAADLTTIGGGEAAVPSVCNIALQASEMQSAASQNRRSHLDSTNTSSLGDPLHRLRHCDQCQIHSTPDSYFSTL